MTKNISRNMNFIFALFLPVYFVFHPVLHEGKSTSYVKALWRNVYIGFAVYFFVLLYFVMR